MSKYNPSPISAHFKIDKKDLVELGYTANDMARFKQISIIEERIYHSSQIRHHLLNPPEVSEDKILFGEANDQQNAHIAAFENNAARFNLCGTILSARKQAYSPESLMISIICSR